jgi:hypothetical protein
VKRKFLFERKVSASGTKGYEYVGVKKKIKNAGAKDVGDYRGVLSDGKLPAERAVAICPPLLTFIFDTVCITFFRFHRKRLFSISVGTGLSYSNYNPVSFAASILPRLS